jgi:hypothetical protein
MAGPKISNQPVERSWTEDVLLDDGTTILIKRYVKFNESDAWTGGAYNAVEWKSRIQFTGALADLPAWDQPFMALVLYKDGTTNEWVVVATTTSCERWSSRGRPSSPYWEYRLKDGQWTAVPLTVASNGHHTNLFINYHPTLNIAHITVTDKNTSLSDPMIYKPYLSIDANVVSNCN